MQHWWGYALITALGPLKLFHSNRYIYIGEGEIIFLKKNYFLGWNTWNKWNKSLYPLVELKNRVPLSPKSVPFVPPQVIQKIFGSQFFVKFG